MCTKPHKQSKSTRVRILKFYLTLGEKYLERILLIIWAVLDTKFSLNKYARTGLLEHLVYIFYYLVLLVTIYIKLF